ncbi:sulfonate ABC transporter permease, partial [Francisella tularensis subsp. holarctica]|nr:sulfonate ABC transporter permease [Francisella tularensis subsp. holarctica]
NKIVNIKYFKKNLDKADNQKVHRKSDKHESVTKRILWNVIIILIILALLYFVYQTVYDKDKDIGIEETIKLLVYGLF